MKKVNCRSCGLLQEPGGKCTKCGSNMRPITKLYPLCIDGCGRRTDKKNQRCRICERKYPWVN